jgi:hypothetical protein
LSSKFVIFEYTLGAKSADGREWKKRERCPGLCNAMIKRALQCNDKKWKCECELHILV